MARVQRIERSQHGGGGETFARHPPGEPREKIRTTRERGDRGKLRLAGQRRQRGEQREKSVPPPRTALGVEGSQTRFAQPVFERRRHLGIGEPDGEQTLGRPIVSRTRHCSRCLLRGIGAEVDAAFEIAQRRRAMGPRLLAGTAPLIKCPLIVGRAENDHVDRKRARKFCQDLERRRERIGCREQDDARDSRGGRRVFRPRNLRRLGIAQTARGERRVVAGFERGELRPAVGLRKIRAGARNHPADPQAIFGEGFLQMEKLPRQPGGPGKTSRRRIDGKHLAKCVEGEFAQDADPRELRFDPRGDGRPTGRGRGEFLGQNHARWEHRLTAGGGEFRERFTEATTRLARGHHHEHRAEIERPSATPAGGEPRGGLRQQRAIPRKKMAAGKINHG